MCARKDLNRNGALNDFDFVSEQSEKGSKESRLQDASNLSLRKPGRKSLNQLSVIEAFMIPLIFLREDT